ncbi:hypothetical protein Bpfe_006336 [Biomphalaria pfeifferi]|uniref:Uncharacterized protein n=1 Tax=Biomphalaria pfeifferi TaxID=112525 RepID=A0AAD8C0C3_BIOPF|nr:hypothetical protein Bpfe_006336 [Biomphalaria pfeifferi]
MENKSTTSPESTLAENQVSTKPSEEQDSSVIWRASEKNLDSPAGNSDPASPRDDLWENTINEDASKLENVFETPADNALGFFPAISAELFPGPEEQDDPAIDKAEGDNDVPRTSQSVLKVKKTISAITRHAKAIKKAPVIAEHTYTFKKTASVLRNPLLQNSESAKNEVKSMQKYYVSVEQYPGHKKDLALERTDLGWFKHACNLKWSPNPTGCSSVVPVKLRKSIRAARLISTDDWRIVEQALKDRREHEMAVELGYETLVGNLLYIQIPHGTDINRSWQNYLSEDTMEWGFPYYKGTTERPRMRQPEPYLAHQVVEKLWKAPKATRRRGNSVEDLYSS